MGYTFVGSWPSRAVWSIVVVRSLPTSGACLEDLGVVADGSVEQSVELLGIDAVGSSILPLRRGVRGLMEPCQWNRVPAELCSSTRIYSSIPSTTHTLAITRASTTIRFTVISYASLRQSLGDP